MSQIQPKVFTSGSSWFDFSGTEYGLLTALALGEASDKIESTTVSTPEGRKAYQPLRSETTITATMYADTGSADITQRVEGVISASYGGKLYTGLGTCYNKSVDGTLDGLIGQTYEFTFNGIVTETQA